MDDYSLAPPSNVISAQGSIAQESEFPPYPQLLIKATIAELIAGDIQFSRHLWSYLLRYQIRILNDSLKRMGNRWMKGFLRSATVQEDDVEARLLAATWCLQFLQSHTLYTLYYANEQLGELFERFGDAAQAQSQRDLNALIFPQRPVFSINTSLDELGASSDEFELTTLSSYRYLPDGLLVTEFNNPSEEIDASIDRTSPFTPETHIDIPAHRLHLFERIGFEITEGNIELAKSLWTNLISSFTHLTHDCIRQFASVSFSEIIPPDNSLSSELVPGELVAAQRAAVVDYVQALRNLYLRVAARADFRLAEVHAFGLRTSESRECLNRYLDLEEAIKSYVPRQPSSSAEPLGNELSAEITPDEPPISISKADQVEAYIRQFEAVVRWENHLISLLERQPRDVRLVREFCQQISDEFSSASPLIQQRLISPLLRISERLKRTRSKLDKIEHRDETLALSWALYYINRALRNRFNYNHPEQEFHDCYEFHNTVRSQPALYYIPEILEELKTCVRRARSIANELLEDPGFLHKLDSEPHFYNFFYSRLGEICRAHYQYRCSIEPELSQVLEQGVTCFVHCLTSRLSPVEVHLTFIYPRLATCLSLLGRYPDAIEYYKALLNLDATNKTSKWEASKSIAEGLMAIAQEIKSDSSINLSQYYAEAESWFVEAAKVWEPDLDIVNSKCSDIRNSSLHYHLAMLHMSAGQYARATQQATWALSLARERFEGEPYKNYRDLITYILAESLAKQDHIDEAVDILKDLVANGVATIHRSKSLLLLKKLYSIRNDEEAVRNITEDLINTGKELENKDFTLLAESSHELFLSYAQMKQYVARCKRHLEAGEVRELVLELPTLVAASKFLSFSRQPDPVLLELLARAYMEIGRYDEAMINVKKSIKAEGSSKNQAIGWSMMGEILKRQGKLLEAAEAFERSYNIGNNLGALLRAANARRRDGDYSQSLQHIEMIQNSGSDKSPEKTNTEAAMTLWSRYCDATQGIGGNEADVVLACDYLKEILLGAFGPAGDSFAAAQLISMSDHPNAREVIGKLLRQSPLPTQLMLLSKLNRRHLYDQEFTQAAIRLLPRKRNLSRKPLTYGPVARYIKSLWIHSYLNNDRGTFERCVQTTIEQLLQRTDDSAFWSTLLAGNREAMGAIIRQKLSEELSAILIENVPHDPEEFLRYLKDFALPRLMSDLETGVLGLSSAAYAGREPGSSLTEELMLVLDSWLCRDRINHLIAPALSFGDQEPRYEATSFQIEIVVSLLNQIHDQVEAQFSTEPLQQMSLRIENASDCILIKMRFRLEPDVTEEAYAEFCRRLFALPVIQNWRPATARLLPKQITMKVRPIRRDVIVTLSVWRSHLPARNEWPWDALYSLVVETPQEETIAWEYYASAQREIFQLLETQKHDLSNYVLSQLDGIFAQVYRTSRLSLSAVPHTIKNILKHITKVEFGDITELGEVAFELKNINKAILKAGGVIKKDFDLRETVKQILDECRMFYPDVKFDLGGGSEGELIAWGAKAHIVAAIWDVIHNSVDAVRRAPREDPRWITVSIIRTSDGLEIVIANTGPTTTSSVERGFGIGSMTVKQVIQKQHSGKVEHGLPIYNEAPFKYEWRLWLPVTTVAGRRAREDA